MMREIKFRAWDRQGRVMFYPDNKGQIWAEDGVGDMTCHIVTDGGPKHINPERYFGDIHRELVILPGGRPALVYWGMYGEMK